MIIDRNCCKYLVLSSLLLASSIDEASSFTPLRLIKKCAFSPSNNNKKLCTTKTTTALRSSAVSDAYFSGANSFMDSSQGRAYVNTVDSYLTNIAMIADATMRESNPQEFIDNFSSQTASFNIPQNFDHQFSDYSNNMMGGSSTYVADAASAYYDYGVTSGDVADQLYETAVENMDNSGIIFDMAFKAGEMAERLTSAADAGLSQLNSMLLGQTPDSDNMPTSQVSSSSLSAASDAVMTSTPPPPPVNPNTVSNLATAAGELHEKVATATTTAAASAPAAVSDVAEKVVTAAAVTTPSAPPAAAAAAVEKVAAVATAAAPVVPPVAVEKVTAAVTATAAAVASAPAPVSNLAAASVSIPPPPPPPAIVEKVAAVAASATPAAVSNAVPKVAVAAASSPSGITDDAIYTVADIAHAAGEVTEKVLSISAYGVGQTLKALNSAGAPVPSTLPGLTTFQGDIVSSGSKFMDETPLGQLAKDVIQSIRILGNTLHVVINAILEDVSGTSIEKLFASALHSADKLVDSAIHSCQSVVNDLGNIPLETVIRTLVAITTTVAKISFTVLNAILRSLSGKGFSGWGMDAQLALDNRIHDLNTQTTLALDNLSHQSLSQIGQSIGHFTQDVGILVASGAHVVSDALQASAAGNGQVFADIGTTISTSMHLTGQ